MLRKIGIAAVLGLAAGPGLAGNTMFDQDFGLDAQPALAGHVELGVGQAYLSQEIGGPFFVNPSSWHNVFTGAGRVNVPLGGRWNLEFEATAHSRWNGAFSSSDFGAYGHLWTMFPSAALGAFGGTSSGALGLPFPPPFGLPFDGESYTAGIEAETYASQFTLGGQASVSYTTTNVCCLIGADFHSWQLRGYAAYYTTPNTKFVGEVKYTNVDGLGLNNFIPHQSRWDFTALVEHRFAGSPWSVWASGSYATFAGNGALILYTANQWQALIGFRLFMDAPNSTLRLHDRVVPFRYDYQSQLIWEPGLG